MPEASSPAKSSNNTVRNPKLGDYLLYLNKQLKLKFIKQTTDGTLVPDLDEQSKALFHQNLWNIAHSKHHQNNEIADLAQRASKIKQKKIDTLFRVLIGILYEKEIDLSEYKYATIIKHFSELAGKIISPNANLTTESLELSYNDLHKKLMGTSPYSASTMAVLGGLTGATAGAASGAALGVLATGWSGGIGALPGAVIGSFTGFNLGSTLGAVAATGLSVAGAYQGTLYAKDRQDEHDAVIAACKEIYDYFLPNAENLFQQIACEAEGYKHSYDLGTKTVVIESNTLDDNAKKAILERNKNKFEASPDALFSLALAINDLKKIKNFPIDIRRNFDALFKGLLVDNKVTVTDKNIHIIILHFTQMAKALKTKPKMSEAELQRWADKLDVAVCGKEPLPTSLKVIIYALFSAILGATVGFIGGAISTSWTGGFGAIPGAIMGAAKGFSFAGSIGMTATATTGAFTFAGAGAGFFKSESEHQKYLDKRKKRYAPENSNDVYKACDSFNPSKQLRKK